METDASLVTEYYPKVAVGSTTGGVNVKPKAEIATGLPTEPT